MDHVINIARDFSDTPGGRDKTDGPFSGQDFRERFLDPLFRDLSDNSKITIVFDGAEGYAISFLEEAFGGLARKYGKDRFFSRVKLISDEDPMIISEINEHLKNIK